MCYTQMCFTCSLFPCILEGTIKNILQPSSVSSQTDMVLVSAIYFKGLWEKAFKEEDTQTVPFRITEVCGHTTL